MIALADKEQGALRPEQVGRTIAFFALVVEQLERRVAELESELDKQRAKK